VKADSIEISRKKERKETMIKYIFSLAMVLILITGVGVGCTSSDNQQSNTDSNSESTGTLFLNLTDAPVDREDISGIYISINKIEVHKSTDGEDTWETVKQYDPEDPENPNPFNLLELTNGEFALLGEFELTAGTYNQIRFILDVQEEGQGPPTTPNSYVELADGTKESLFVPSGGQSGYKAVGEFEVPVNGEVKVTVDFDVRKSLHVTGNGNNQKYKLQPTLRLVVDSKAGNIDGTITLTTTYDDIVVFAYEDGEWNDSEAETPAEGEPRFPNAVTSNKMDEDNSYILAYLAYGTYDLVVAEYNGEDFVGVLGMVSDVVLNSNHTAQDINDGNLEAV